MAKGRRTTDHGPQTTEFKIEKIFFMLNFFEKGKLETSQLCGLWSVVCGPSSEVCVLHCSVNSLLWQVFCYIIAPTVFATYAKTNRTVSLKLIPLIETYYHCKGGN